MCMFLYATVALTVQTVTFLECTARASVCWGGGDDTIIIMAVSE